MAAKKTKVTRWQCQCEKCKKEWESRTEEKPGMCPFCKTTLWNAPKQAEWRAKQREKTK